MGKRQALLVPNALEVERQERNAKYPPKRSFGKKEVKRSEKIPPKTRFWKKGGKEELKKYPQNAFLEKGR